MYHVPYSRVGMQSMKDRGCPRVFVCMYAYVHWSTVCVSISFFSPACCVCILEQASAVESGAPLPVVHLDVGKARR